MTGSLMGANEEPPRPMRRPIIDGVLDTHLDLLLVSLPYSLPRSLPAYEKCGLGAMMSDS